MEFGAITQYVDVAQLTLYAFWIFFFGLIIYLHREGMREGYPAVTENPDRIRNELWPVPAPKSFKLANGQTVTVPRRAESRPLALAPADGWPGAPQVPTGNPMKDGVGPASWSEREDAPDVGFEGKPVIMPLRLAPDFSVAPQDIDPRGLEVHGADHAVAGKVADVWIDVAEVTIRYLEVELASGGRKLLPMTMCRVKSVGQRSWVKVESILASQFADVPGLRNPDQVTKLEEDKITGYYAGGTLYATPARSETLI